MRRFSIKDICKTKRFTALKTSLEGEIFLQLILFLQLLSVCPALFFSLCGEFPLSAVIFLALPKTDVKTMPSFNEKYKSSLAPERVKIST